MVTTYQVQRGFTRFVDSEVAVAFNGWQKAVVAGTASLLVANIDRLVESYPLVSALGVYDQEACMVDIDKLYNAYVPQLGSDKIPVAIPKIATIKLGKEEIDTLVRYIKEA